MEENEDEDKLPSDLEPQHRIEVRMGQKARRSYIMSYVEPWRTIADLHYEVARVTRRNAWSFQLSLDEQAMEGPEEISKYGDDLQIKGEPIPGWEQWGDDHPPISAQRGGTPSSLRARLGRRIAKEAADIPDPIGLLHQLWPAEARALSEFNGDNAALIKLCRALIAKHKAVHSVHGWRLEHLGAPEDPWQKADPWAHAAAKAPKPTHHALDLADKEVADAFEQADLETSFITSEKKVLPQRRRATHMVNEAAVILCTHSKFTAFAHG